MFRKSNINSYPIYHITHILGHTFVYVCDKVILIYEPQISDLVIEIFSTTTFGEITLFDSNLIREKSSAQFHWTFRT